MSISNVFSIFCLINFVLLELVFSLTDILSPLALLLFGLFFLALPITVLLYTLQKIRKTSEGKRWPYVRGKISDIEEKSSILDIVREKRFVLIYDYYVKDRLHSNDQFNPNKVIISKKDLFHNPQLRNKDIKDIEGTYIKVFFNPKNPWESMICNKTYFDFSSLLLPSANTLIITLYIFNSIY